MNNVESVVLLVALFGVTIFVHEFGHFLTARLCGMVVDVFSIGFGPALWKRRFRGVIYKLGCIPFGGYVALPQLDPTGMNAVQGKSDGTGVVERKLPAVEPWKKMLVSVSGAVGNAVLAVAIAWVVYWVGMPAGPAERSTVVGYVSPRCPAHEQGLRIGDEILSVNGVAVHKWSDLRVEAALSREVKLDVRTLGGEVRSMEVPTGKGVLGEQSLVGVEGRDLCTVLSVDAGMAADKAGIRPGDTIVALGGEKVLSRAHLIALVNEHKDEPVSIAVRRPEGARARPFTTTVTPAYDAANEQVRIGIRFNVAAVEMDTVVHPLPSEQLKSHAAAIFRFLRALVTPKQAKAATQAVGGPVAIAASYWVIVKASLMLAVWFTGLLNVNLAILNLLPIPVLDGGHIVFSLWEVVTRRPINAKVANALVNAFAVALIVVMVILSFRDLLRFTPAGRYVSEWGNGRTKGAAGAPGQAAATNGAPRAAETNR